MTSGWVARGCCVLGGTEAWHFRDLANAGELAENGVSKNVNDHLDMNQVNVDGPCRHVRAPAWMRRWYVLAGTDCGCTRITV